MIKRPNTKAQRIKRHKRVRSKISGTPERPRLSVYRSENNIYAHAAATFITAACRPWLTAPARAA